MRNKCSSILFFLIVFISCNKNQKIETAEKIVSEWIGKTIVYPDNSKIYSNQHDSIYTQNTLASYKILVYVDSTGCTSCKLNLPKWKQYMHEADSAFSQTIDFIFYFYPKNEKDIISILNENNFNYPVFIDIRNEIGIKNEFPDKIEYQCFLLDKDNKVILVGNPTLNNRIWTLFKQVIRKETSL